MEFRKDTSCSIRTLTVIAQVSSSSQYADDRLIFCEKCQTRLPSPSSPEACSIANSPQQYSPFVGQESFSFLDRISSTMSPVGDMRIRRRFRLRKLFSAYAKLILTCGMLFTCFLLLETSYDGRTIHTRFGTDTQGKVGHIESIPRFRRSSGVSIDSEHKSNIVRDGPIFDLGDGYAASRGSDVLITVKTSGKFHSSRLSDILDTWFRLAPDQIYFITDTNDENLNDRIGGKLVSTGCPFGHNRDALCCKQSFEYETYLQHERSWWCHFDDDNYVNVPQLMRTLGQYDPRQDWYLGKPSTKGPIETTYRDYGSDSEPITSNERIPFWFATGGAGFCISKSLAMKMRPYATNGKFVALCDRIRLPDDVTVGYLIEVLLEKNLTVVPTFHSHLENMRSINMDQLHEQVTLSGGSYDDRDRNLVNVDQFFPDTDDPRRFRSLHCHLYPTAAVCKRPPPDAA